MTKNIIITITILTAALLMPLSVSARTVCTTEGDYGQKVVCWEEAEGQVLGVHEPLETDLADSLPLIAGAAILVSGSLYITSRKLAKSASLIG